jgi:hypothetical protein
MPLCAHDAGDHVKHQPTPAARVDAVVRAPVAFRRRGVYVAPQALEVA